MTLDQLYLSLLPSLERMAEHACRRYGLRREEIEDFTQELKLKIFADDYAVLRKHQGRSKLETYLTVVTQRAALDYVHHKWGKWRNSAQARRLGALAMQLETLLVRDRRSFDDACQVLWTDCGVKDTARQLAELTAKLPPPRWPRRTDDAQPAESSADHGGRGPRHQTSDLQAGFPATPPASADEGLWSAERARCYERVMAALKAALKGLPAEDRVIVKMRSEGFSVVAIARQMRLEQKPLYKREKKVCKRLRQAMERAGISSDDISDILGHAADD